MKNRNLFLLAALLTAGALSLPALRADDPVPKSNGQTSTVGSSKPMDNELDPDTRQAVDKGLKWLANHINNDGTISDGGTDAAMMSLAGIAFLADGNMPGNGPYGPQVEKILDYVLKNCQESGLIYSPNPMYGHGFATLFLAEIYGMSPRQDLKEKLEKAIKLMVLTQNYQGGWRYQPAPNDADISVTICQVMALRAARGAGIKVPKKTIDAAIDYVKQSQEADGGFSYMLASRGSAFPRSAAGVACLYYLRSGNDFADEIKRGVAYLTGRTGPARIVEDGHFYYGNYYATQAMFMTGGSAWETYWPAIKATLLSKQNKDAGNWSGEAGDTYATAMSLIMLQVPNRLLPILQK